MKNRLILFFTILIALNVQAQKKQKLKVTIDGYMDSENIKRNGSPLFIDEFSWKMKKVIENEEARTVFQIPESKITNERTSGFLQNYRGILILICG